MIDRNLVKPIVNRVSNKEQVKIYFIGSLRRKGEGNDIDLMVNQPISRVKAWRIVDYVHNSLNKQYRVDLFVPYNNEKWFYKMHFSEESYIHEQRYEPFLPSESEIRKRYKPKPQEIYIIYSRGPHSMQCGWLQKKHYDNYNRYRDEYLRIVDEMNHLDFIRLEDGTLTARVLTKQEKMRKKKLSQRRRELVKKLNSYRS